MPAIWPVTVSGSGQPVRAPNTLSIRLTAGPSISQTTRDRLVEEASAIWRRAGIELIWLAGAADERSLRVVVVPRAAVDPPDTHPVGLAELLGLGRLDAIALAASNRADDLVTRSRSPGIVPAARHDDRVGLVLARAVAHEIGHYLLNTRTHAEEGLMRAVFETGELVDPRSPRFDLDRTAVTWLRERFARNEPVGPDSAEFVAVVARR